jgi:hypothetical protein
MCSDWLLIHKASASDYRLIPSRYLLYIYTAATINSLKEKKSEWGGTQKSLQHVIQPLFGHSFFIYFLSIHERRHSRLYLSVDE